MKRSVHLIFCFSHIFVLVATNSTRYKREAVSLQPYNYRFIGRYGQKNWGTFYPKCSYNRQSPIDINLKYMKAGDFETSLRTTNIGNKPLSVKIRNNGYTAYFKYDWACCPPKIYGGPLKHIYEFSSLHFHWGVDNTCGTEHSVGGEHGAMEAHMVFKSVEFETKEEAINYPDGLCVFALRYVCDPNAKPFSLLEGIQFIPEWGDTAQTFYPNTSPLTEIIGDPDFHYAYYEGSLTTPPCSESVQWIVNLNKIPLNCAQLSYFRAMKDKLGLGIAGNYRATQKLNNRDVYVS